MSDCSLDWQNPKEQFLPFTAGEAFQGVIWQYESEALKICRYFDPAVPPGTDPKETVKDIHRDLIRSVFTKTLLMVLKKLKLFKWISGWLHITVDC